MRYIVMAMIMVLTSLDLSAAELSADTRESLRGLTGVGVVIEEISSDAQADGLSVEEIRTAVELILRSSRIRILTRSERFKTPSSPYLYVRVSALKSKVHYSLCVQVALRQDVSLVHRPQHIIIGVQTWGVSSFGHTGRSKLSEENSLLVEPLVKEFANDFLAANPR